MTPSTRTQVVAALMGLLFAAGCSSSSSDPGANGETGTGGSRAVDVKAACHGTVSGSANGEFTCMSDALLFLPNYQSDVLRGNTEFTFQSSTKYNLGVSPPGIESIIFAGVFPGEMRPGTYTEAQLLETDVSAAAVIFKDKRYLSAVTRLNLVVTGVTHGSAHDDVVTGRGQTREDHALGSIELVMGTGADEVTISGTLE